MNEQVQPASSDPLFNPLAPERIAERRAAVLDFISAALFRPKGNVTQGARS